MAYIKPTYIIAIFIARQHDIDIAILSVRPSVCDTLVLNENGLTHRHNFFFTIR